MKRLTITLIVVCLAGIVVCLHPPALWGNVQLQTEAVFFCFYAMPLLALVLTLLAWRAGVRAIASGGESKAVRARTWPAMLFLAGAVAMALGLFLWLRVGLLFGPIAIPRMLEIGATASVAALVASTWAPSSFRFPALCAAAAWAGFFGRVLYIFAHMGRP